jgi:hypothetical protein
MTKCHIIILNRDTESFLSYSNSLRLRALVLGACHPPAPAWGPQHPGAPPWDMRYRVIATNKRLREVTQIADFACLRKFRKLLAAALLKLSDDDLPSKANFRQGDR